MMRSLGLSLGLWAALAASAPCVHAQVPIPVDGGSHHTVVLGLAGGPSLPSGDAASGLARGWNGMAYLRLNPEEGLVSLGVTGSYQRFHLENTRVGPSAAFPPFAGGIADLLSGMLDLELHVTHARVHPYLLIGFGADRVHVATTDAGSEAATRWGASAGAGLQAGAGPVTFFVQGRVDVVSTRNQHLVRADRMVLVPVSFGLEF